MSKSTVLKTVVFQPLAETLIAPFGLHEKAGRAGVSMRPLLSTVSALFEFVGS